MTLNDMQKVAKLFFREAKINCEAWFDTWFQETFSEGFPAAAVTNACTRKAVAVVRDELFGPPVVSSSKETQEVIHEEASPSPDNGDSVEQSEAPKTPLLDEELASLSLDKETREAVDGLLKEFAKKIDFSDEPGMDSLLSAAATLVVLNPDINTGFAGMELILEAETKRLFNGFSSQFEKDRVPGIARACLVPYTTFAALPSQEQKRLGKILIDRINRYEDSLQAKLLGVPKDWLVRKKIQ